MLWQAVGLPLFSPDAASQVTFLSLPLTLGAILRAPSWFLPDYMIDIINKLFLSKLCWAACFSILFPSTWFENNVYRCFWIIIYSCLLLYNSRLTCLSRHRRWPFDPLHPCWPLTKQPHSLWHSSLTTSLSYVWSFLSLNLLHPLCRQGPP